MRNNRIHSLFAIPLTLSIAGCVVGDGSDEDDDLLIEAGATAQLTFVQHNVEKKDSAIDNAIQEAKRTNAVGIALQEVCPPQVAKLRQKYGDQWTIGEVPGKKPVYSGCPLPDGKQDKASVLVIWTGGKGGNVTQYPVLAGPDALPGLMVCVEFQRAKTPIHFCSAHLLSADWTDPTTQTVYDGATWRAHQTAAIRQIARDHWFGGSKNHFGVIAGDFNGTPDTAPLDNMYDSALGGKGDFTEYNRSGAGRDGRITAVANGDNTVDHEPYDKKIDYIFFSTNRAPIDGATAQVDPDASDHHMVTSTVRMRK